MVERSRRQREQAAKAHEIEAAKQQALAAVARALMLDAELAMVRAMRLGEEHRENARRVRIGTNPLPVRDP